MMTYKKIFNDIFNGGNNLTLSEVHNLAAREYAEQCIKEDRRKIVDFMIDSKIDKADITTSDIINLPIILP